MSWRPFTYRFMATDEKSTPPFVAPIHPRLDQAIFYDPLGNNGSDVFSVGGNLGTYGPGNSSVWARLQARLCLGAGEPVNRLFWSVPFPDPATPPDWVRASLYFLRPTTLVEWARTGNYWHKERMGTHMPAVKRSSDWEEHESTARHLLPSHRLGGPEVWGPENLTWIFEGAVTHSAHKVTEQDLDALWSFVAFARDMVRLGARRAGGLHPVADGRADSAEEDSNAFAASSFPPGQFDDPMDDGTWLDSDTQEAAIKDVRQFESKETSDIVNSRVEHHRQRLGRGGSRAAQDSSGSDSNGSGSSFAADHPMDVDEARNLLQWRSLPFLYRRMLVRYTASQLRRLQTVMGAVVGPVAAAMRSVVSRPSPSGEEVGADLLQLGAALRVAKHAGARAGELSQAILSACACWQGASSVKPDADNEVAQFVQRMQAASDDALCCKGRDRSDVDAALAQTVKDRIEGAEAARETFPELPEAFCRAYALHRTAWCTFVRPGDDFMCPGPMKDAQKALGYAQWILMAGGRRAFEAAAGGRQQLLGRTALRDPSIVNVGGPAAALLLGVRPKDGISPFAMQPDLPDVGGIQDWLAREAIASEEKLSPGKSLLEHQRSLEIHPFHSLWRGLRWRGRHIWLYSLFAYPSLSFASSKADLMTAIQQPKHASRHEEVEGIPAMAYHQSELGWRSRSLRMLCPRSGTFLRRLRVPVFQGEASAMDWRLVGFTDGKAVEPHGPGDLPVPMSVLQRLEPGAQVDPSDEIRRRAPGSGEQRAAGLSRD